MTALDTPLQPSQAMMDGAFCVAVVDDDDDVRRLIVVLLKNAGYQVEDFATPSAFLERAKQGTPYDCVLLDEFMDEIDGLETFSELKNLGCQFPAIMVTGGATPDLTMKAIDLGFSYLFEKPIHGPKLIARTERYCEEYRNSRNELVRKAIEQTKLDALSDRELQVLRLLASGYLNKQIASELEVGLRTVETYRNRVMSKIGASCFADAVAFAISVGLRKPGVRRHSAG
ncbi:MAG: response regulator [Planctomycetota bacterium]